MPRRDIAVIGASSGGIEALRELLERLPADFPAAILVVIHIPDLPSLLPETLGRHSGLPVRFARDGDSLAPGTVLVAPPNRHLLVHGTEKVELAQTARENGFRPAIDPLFRSAAHGCDGRVMGIVLSGALDDGAAGMWEIKRNGGVAIAQDFDEALFSSMPRAAAAQVEGAHVLTVRGIAEFITQLARGFELDEPLERDPTMEHEEPSERQPTDLSCPQCGGVLRASAYACPEYACHVGHTYAPEALVADQSEELDRTLWAAVRVLRETAALRRAMAVRVRSTGLEALGEAYERQAGEAEEKAETIRRVFEGPRR
jgi:two-component system, chemotaxis family, protein-glutamate methylesterase/glutaminase